MAQNTLTGKLQFLALGDIIQLIGSNGRSGVLKLFSDYAPESGVIYFDKGNIINASSPSKKGKKAVFALFGWMEGRFDFFPETVEIKQVIKENRMSLILDGLRMVDDGSTERLPPLDQNTGSADIDDGAVTFPLITGPPVDYIYILAEDSFPPEQEVVREDTHGNWLWVVLEGRVEVIKSTPKGSIRLYEIGEDGIIGSIDAFSFKNQSRNTSVLSLTEVQLGVLDVQRLTQEYNGISETLNSIIESLDKRLRDVTEQVVSVYLDTNPAKTVLQGTKSYLKQGENTNRGIFIIKEGTAYIIRETPVKPILLAQLEPGDVIGDLSVMFPIWDQEPAGASVYVSEDFKAEAIDIEAVCKDYKKMTSSLQSVAESLASGISAVTQIACAYQLQHQAGASGAKKK